MKGSEKQIAWATDIIEKLETAYNEIIKTHGEAPASVAQMIEEILNTDDAKKAIDSPFANAKRMNATWLEKFLTNMDGDIGDEAFQWIDGI